MSYAGILYVQHALCSRMEARLLVTMHHRMRAPPTRLSLHACIVNAITSIHT